MRKLLTKICTILACLHLTAALAAGAEPQAVPRAFVDQVVVDSAARTMQLAGWAVSSQGKAGIPTLQVLAGDEEIYRGHAAREPRPDVAKATTHSDWIDSGWRLTVRLPDTVHSGTQRLLVKVQFDSEAPIDSVPSTPENAFIHISQAGWPCPGTWVGLLVGASFLLISYFFATPVSRLLSRWTRFRVPPPASPAIGIVAFFAILVALGVSGSSVGQAQDGGIPIQGIRFALLANTPKPIRSDEWLVLSPMAIAQVRHHPAFPVVNKNVGPDGQNMLVVGMTSVPVLGLSALGRPATWGYFFLPLPQAMAWHWWFPAFACVLGLWGCFSVLFRGQWRMGLLLSLCFVMSPYVIAWSYWPAYVTMFAATAFASVVALLTGTRRWGNPLLAVLIGVSVSGFVLTLYPAWQVPIAYLFALLLFAVAIRDWKSLRFSAANMSWLMLGLVLAGAIVGSWWHDARDAVAAMVATIYPGQRTAVPGGGIDPWYLSRGFTNFRTIYGDLKGVSNQSEVSSFVYFFLPALIGAFFNGAYKGKNKPIFFAILAFLALAFWYQYFGFPVQLAKLSQWGRTFPTRVDIAVGVASIALLGTALATNTDSADRVQKTRSQHVGAIIVAALWTAAIWWSLRHAPEPVTGLMGRPRTVFLLLFVGWCSYALASRWSKAFLVSLLGFLTFTTAAFNPWTVIANSSASESVGGKCSIGDGRTLVIGSHLPAMTLMASGCPVLNGVSYYPQMSLWRVLDPAGKQADIYNRYQHIFVELSDLKGSPIPVLISPQSDMVRLTVDPRAFNFARLPISYVLVRSDAAMDLSSNPALQKMPPPASGWTRFKVVP